MSLTTVVIPPKIAFVHIPKTAGVFVDGYIKNLFYRSGHKVHELPPEKRDWTQQELLEIADDPAPAQYVKNHSPQWSEEVFYAFGEKGWFTFAFARHPGDLLCSLYHYLRGQYAGCLENAPDASHLLPLDEFIVCRIKGDSGWHLPAFWRDLDYIAEFSEVNFADFLRIYFHVSYWISSPLNSSRNLGYYHYCSTGAISLKTQVLLESSREFLDYREILSRPQFAMVNSDQP